MRDDDTLLPTSNPAAAAFITAPQHPSCSSLGRLLQTDSQPGPKCCFNFAVRTVVGGCYSVDSSCRRSSRDEQQEDSRTDGGVACT